MNRIKTTLFAALLAGAGLAACTDDGTSGFQNALTGEVCEPDPATLRPHGRSGGRGNGGQNSPTGIPGDNMDDEHSGKIDCYYDGNSGQGDDKKHPCCDAGMCCNTPPPAEDPPAEDPPAEDPPAEDPPAEDPPAEDPPSDEPPPSDDPPPPVDLPDRMARASWKGCARLVVSTDRREPMNTELGEPRPRAAMRTDIGLRSRNEDAAFIDPDGVFAIVADGMGGQAAGEVASRMAVDIVREALEAVRPRIAAFAAAPDHEERRGITAALDAAVRSAHDAVYRRGCREQDKQGMGAALDVVVVAGTEAFVGHVGDTRTYLIRQGQAAQVTTDHTMAAMMVLEGTLSTEEAGRSPLRAVLVNAVGATDADVVVEIAHVSLENGDRLLVCSDGLHDCFDEQELAEQFALGGPAQVLFDAIELAKQRGSHDNITGVLLDVPAIDESCRDAAPPTRAETDDEVTQPFRVWDAVVVELRDAP